MTPFKAPLENIRFISNEVFNFSANYSAFPTSSVEADIVNQILDEAARFSENILAPLYASGDQDGACLKEGQVGTPAGFKQAYQQYVDGGWGGISAPEEFGGQGLPESLNISVLELMAAANISWVQYPGLTHGAVAALTTHGSEQQKQLYLPKMVEGSWSGTMCLTEAHCGSDLGLIKTRAIPIEGGEYSITGTKVFISAGDQDLTENIVHLVLAKLPDAPAGTKGISLFLVPKFIPDADGNLGKRNAASCGSIEHKMGMHAAATCVMNFDGATGYLVGKPNKGLSCMFTFMNNARIVTALQGLCLGERSFQAAYAYANERLQGRSLSGVKMADKPADPIICHADVRRMLMTMKALNEGNRALAYFALEQLDFSEHGEDEEQKKEAEKMLSFVTPICKAFITETGNEVANLGVQIFGGHGYIRETGVEQIVRDARISTIYEGTTTIQGLDLLGRKVLSDQGETLRQFLKLIVKLSAELECDEVLKPHAIQLASYVKQWGEVTQKVGSDSMRDKDEIGAAATDYILFAGYVCLGYFWLRMAHVAKSKIASGNECNERFYEAKLATCGFYFDRILPRAAQHLSAINAGGASMMKLDAEQIGL